MGACQFCFSHVQLCATLWTVAHQAPLSMGFSRKEYWSRLPCSPPGNLPNPGIEPTSLMSPTLASGFFTTSITWEVQFKDIHAMFGGITTLIKFPFLYFQFKFNWCNRSLFAKSEDLSNIQVRQNLPVASILGFSSLFNSFIIFLSSFIGVYLLYNVVLVSAVQKFKSFQSLNQEPI